MRPTLGLLQTRLVGAATRRGGTALFAPRLRRGLLGGSWHLRPSRDRVRDHDAEVLK
jgi:hypothetical protein